MITAVDTSVLIAIVKAEPDAHAWIALLARARTAGDLVVCEVVVAEFFALLMDRAKFAAGRLFRQYRRLGGPREHLVPDFLIGAHAQHQADRIAAIDRGYLRRYFPRLNMLRPR